MGSYLNENNVNKAAGKSISKILNNEIKTPEDVLQKLLSSNDLNPQEGLAQAKHDRSRNGTEDRDLAPKDNSEQGIDPKQVNAKLQELLIKTKEFQRTHDGSVFNDFLHYKNSIKDDLTKSKEYDDMVKKVEDKLPIEYSNESFDPENSNWEDIKNKSAPPEALKYMAAAKLVEAFHGNEKILDAATKNLKMGFFKIPEKSGTAALYSSDRYMVADPGEFVKGMAVDNVAYDPFIHELTHSLDGSDSPDNKADGKFAFMSLQEQKDYQEERDNLMAKEKSSPSGLRDYAFTSDEEYAAVIGGEEFFKRPHLLQKVAPKTYSILASNYKYDPTQVVAA